MGRMWTRGAPLTLLALGALARAGGAEVPTHRDVSEAVAPTYPPIAAAAQVEGTVEARVTVAPSGDVTASEIAAGPVLLKKAVEAVLPLWRFAASERESAEELRFVFELVPWDGSHQDPIPITVIRAPGTMTIRRQISVISDPYAEISGKAKGDKKK
jgi:Gram-negative bacterial TonB protein C-terminal